MSFYDKMRRQKFLSLTVLLFTLAIGILIGTLAQTSAKAAKEQTAAPDATPLTIPPSAPVENEFTRVAKELEPSVVNISIDYIPKTTKKAALLLAGASNRRMTMTTRTAGRDREVFRTSFNASSARVAGAISSSSASLKMFPARASAPVS